MTPYEDDPPTLKWRRPWTVGQTVAFTLAFAAALACTVRWWP